ncbi:hypothetical protein, partial [Acidovorax delafieldii]|uniref:hypothetical protein n=1 Tax=Acidovorax delafieldii TaxID=47920 RepID=UPI0012FD29CE
MNSSPGDLRADGTDAVTARWVRDDTYRDRAVRLAFLDRPGLARFLAPLWIALAVALVFSPWGAMVGLFTLNLREVHASMLILAALMLLLGGANTFHAMHAATARQFAFAGDSVYWRFTPHGLSYRVTGGTAWCATGPIRSGAGSRRWRSTPRACACSGAAPPSRTSYRLRPWMSRARMPAAPAR